MSSISEVSSQRMTLADLVDRYGFELQEQFAGDVTITSLANDVESVTPGALYMPGEYIEAANLAIAAQKGAYAAVLPHSMKTVAQQSQIPVLLAEPTPHQLGMLASEIAGSPAQTLAVFAIAGQSTEDARNCVEMLAQFLHMLGNPVGTVCQGDSQSLERFLDVKYPVDVFSMQRVMSVCAEDGAAAVIIALDGKTLQSNSMQTICPDVIGYDGDADRSNVQNTVSEICKQYGCGIGNSTHVVTRTEESDSIARQVEHDEHQIRQFSLAVAMVLAAGVRKSSIKSALRVSRELR